MKRPLRWLARIVGGLFALLLTLFAVLYVTQRHALPDGVEGEAAEALARRMNAAVNADAWARTGAVRWRTRDGARHLWDRARNLERYENDDLRVLLDLGTRRGRAWRGGQALQGDALRGALDRAWARWANDSFWLNPVPKVFDGGVRRALARDDEGRDALRVTYTVGGVTPGDRYLWILDGQGRPRAWRMWVSVLPIPGLEASWEGWITLPTGAQVSTVHRIAGLRITLDGIAAAETLAALEGPTDPFGGLVGAP
ncbi:MAG: hypothetical protein U0325_23385 [Polyangiales bacterium]